MQLPRMFMIRQNFPDRRLHNIPDEVRRELSQAQFQTTLAPGSRIAIGVGSRGIANITTIVRAVVAFWKDAGMKPFIFPAMGSHGAASAEGQADVLAHYGIIEETVGCPILSSLEVVSLGQSADGIESFMDRHAFEADGVMLVGRVKWHTDFAGKIESGLYKMMAIGLGKFHGAQRYHTYAYNLGLEHVIRSIGRQVLKSGKILGGLAILEDANHNTAQLTAVPVGEMEQREEELLARVKSWMGHLPVSAHILILDQIGKPISGAGMDTKVVNRGVNGEYNPWPNTPKFNRVFVRDLHPNSYGNGVGLGMADVISNRLLDKIDWNPTQINSLTASTPRAVQTPLHYTTDRECLERMAPTVGLTDLSQLRICWVKNSLEINFAMLSENLRSEVEKNQAIEVLSDPAHLPFDSHGNLQFVFAGDHQAVGVH